VIFKTIKRIFSKHPALSREEIIESEDRFRRAQAAARYMSWEGRPVLTDAQAADILIARAMAKPNGRVVFLNSRQMGKTAAVESGVHV